MYRRPVEGRSAATPGCEDGIGNAPVPSGPVWLARPASTNLHALEGRPPRSAGTEARLAPRRSPPRSPAAPRQPTRGPGRGIGPGLIFGLNSPPSGAVHRRPPVPHPRRPRTVAANGEHRSAVLESVLGATPREFESRILRHPGQARCGILVTGLCAPGETVVSVLATERSRSRAAGMPLSIGAVAIVPGHGGPGPPWTGRTHAAEACLPVAASSIVRLGGGPGRGLAPGGRPVPP